VPEFGGPVEVVLAFGSSAPDVLFHLLAQRLNLASAWRSASPCRPAAPSVSARTSASSRRSCSNRAGWPVVLLGQCRLLDLNRVSRRVSSVQLRWHRVDFGTQHRARSSTRSIALSGRNRSEMYRWLNTTADTSALS